MLRNAEYCLAVLFALFSLLLQYLSIISILYIHSICMVFIAKLEYFHEAQIILRL